jgi:cytochrome c6
MARTNSIVVMFFVFVSFTFSAANTCFSEESGEALFKKYCAVCHVDGGNIVNPLKTFHKKDLDANKVKTEEDVLKIMRNPGPGMTRFSEKTVPDPMARKIATYILSAF